MSTPRPDSRELRHFGLLVGGVLALIALWPLLFRGEAPRAWAGIPAALLIALGLIAPQTLSGVHALWMRLAHALGSLNTRLLLAATYFLLLTPTGAIMRGLGRDPLDRRLGDRPSYWLPRQRPGTSKRSMELRF